MLCREGGRGGRGFSYVSLGGFVWGEGGVGGGGCGGKEEHTSFSPTATSKFLPRGITCAISPKATVSLLPLTNFTLKASITSGLLPVCLNLANSALSDSRIRSIAASKAEKSSGSTGTLLLLLVVVVCPFPPLLPEAGVVWADDLSFLLRRGADELRGRWSQGWRQRFSGAADGERKGGGGSRLRRRRRHIEGWRGRKRVIRVLAGWEVNIVAGHKYSVVVDAMR